MNYQDFDAASLMQQAPANFLSPETMASMPFGQGFQGYSNPNLAGSWMNMLQPTFRHGVGGAMNQPNNAGSLPGATTTLPTSPEQTPTQKIEGVDPNLVYIMENMKKDANTDWKEQADYFFAKRKEEAERANKMGQWNTIMGSVLKDLPRNLSEQYRRSNMYIGDMLKSQADAARERSVGIQQAIASMPGAPARNYIRI